MRILQIMLVVMVLALTACKSDKYVSNRFAGVYEITKYERQHWDSTGMLSSTEIPCNYVFYFSANGNQFEDASGKLDTSGVEPAFLAPLLLGNFGGLSRFTFKWNIGTSDNYRLSLLKDDDFITYTSLVTMQRNVRGRVKAFTYVVNNSDGSYFYDIYEVKVRH